LTFPSLETIVESELKMARPPTIRDEDILEAARAVLLERGLFATAAEVATRAGISEGSIFHRFKTKEALFGAAFLSGQGASDLPEWITSLSRRVGKSTIEEQLETMCHEGIAFFRLLIPFVMLTWSKGPQDHGPGEPPPIRALKGLAAYFEAEMNAGRLAVRDPEVVARTFMGALWNFVSMELMFESRERMPLAQATFVRSFCALLLDGLTPRHTSPAPKKGSL
jgi:AcrR family transcriptional regulator